MQRYIPSLVINCVCFFDQLPLVSDTKMLPFLGHQWKCNGLYNDDPLRLKITVQSVICPIVRAARISMATQ